ncbi:c-type cytochrome [Acidithiobacillus sp. IBUN Pt1247-S3]|uniref:c-type cytochrome n=1 Tax=Acidithiobacillus sp. IBUN Pt1247-S3 TaxID=3166642 RepID=UPI0034E60E52
MLSIVGLAAACGKGNDNSSATASSSSTNDSAAASDSGAAASSDSAATTSPAAYTPSVAAHLVPVAMSTDQMAKAKSLAEAKGCFACHQVDAKVVGPAFAWVAYKYKGNPKAEGKLADAIEHGISGVWGGMPMPAQSVTPAQAKELASWVLAQKPIAPPKAS